MCSITAVSAEMSASVICQAFISAEETLVACPCYLTGWYLRSAAADSWYIWHLYCEHSNSICFCHSHSLMCSCFCAGESFPDPEKMSNMHLLSRLFLFILVFMCLSFSSCLNHVTLALAEELNVICYSHLLKLHRNSINLILNHLRCWRHLCKRR